MLYFSNFFEESKTILGHVSGNACFYSYVFSNKLDWEHFLGNSKFFTSNLAKLRATQAPGVIFTMVIRKENEQTYFPFIYKGHDRTVALMRGNIKDSLGDACNDCLRMFADFISLHKADNEGKITFEPKKFPFLN